MFLAIDAVLTPPEVQAIRSQAAGLTFQDGKATAGRYAREVKANDQAAPSPERDAIFAKVERSLLANDLFNLFARPRALSGLLLSRYRQGQTYGLHVDDALMGGIRTDLSFTLFLSEEDSYDGGALITEDTLESRAIRLPAGSLILYPSGTLHRVAPVTSGERLAIVGWVQSWVRSAAEREILFDLEQALRLAHAAGGKSDLSDLLAKSRSNLLRLWAGN